MPDGHDRRRLRSQPVEPFAGRHRLAGLRVVAEPAPVALALDGLVGDRALDDEHERIELAAIGLEEPFDEIVGAAHRAVLEVDQRPVDGDLGQAGEGAQGDLLDAGLSGSGQGDRVTVTAEPGVDPQDVDQCLVYRRCHVGPPTLANGHSNTAPFRACASSPRGAMGAFPNGWESHRSHRGTGLSPVGPRPRLTSPSAPRRLRLGRC